MTAAVPNGEGSPSDLPTNSGSKSYRPGDAFSFPERVTSIKLATRPRQRQRWNDKQMLPHVNWGDLFWDLFYVAAAYNLSNIILSDPNVKGLLYFVGLFGPIMYSWFHRLRNDAQFSFGDDPYHRLYELVNLCFLATAVAHIRPVDVMSNPSKYPDMFCYALAVTLLSAMKVFRTIELYFWADGDREAIKNFSLRWIPPQIMQLVLYLAAAIISGLAYYGDENSGSGGSDYGDGSGKNRVLFGRSSCSAIEGVLSSFAEQCGLNTRFLAAASDYDSDPYDDKNSNDLPVWLCLGSYLFSQIYALVTVVFCFPGGGRHKKISVPMNIDFTIHRQGEWVMLLLGESILSLLIVETSVNIDYYVTFYAGIISVVLLQYLHFRSQPHHADEHAMRRNKNAGVAFGILLQVYSCALVLVGVSFKMLLYEYVYRESDGYGRKLIQFLRKLTLRHLAGGGDRKYDTEERQQRVAHFFCGSMAVAWFTLDLMVLTHRGLKSNVQRCECPVTKKKQFWPVLLVSIRVALICFIATLSLYVQQPEPLSVLGMVGILAQVAMRALGDLVYPKVPHECHGANGDERDNEDEKWPNVTHPEAQASDEHDEDKEDGYDA